METFYITKVSIVSLNALIRFWLAFFNYFFWIFFRQSAQPIEMVILIPMARVQLACTTYLSSSA